MENRVGFRFVPTDEEIIEHYIRLKNIGGSTNSHVDEAISTVDICNFDPWELPCKSRRESRDQVWYFFGWKDNRGERQSRKTNSGFWKKTGETAKIFRKRGNGEQIGEKKKKKQKKFPRIKGKFESPKKKKKKKKKKREVEKLGRAGRTVHCGSCGEAGHNANGCKVHPKKKMKKTHQTVEEGTSSHIHEEIRVTQPTQSTQAQD